MEREVSAGIIRAGVGDEEFRVVDGRDDSIGSVVGVSGGGEVGVGHVLSVVGVNGGAWVSGVGAVEVEESHFSGKVLGVGSIVDSESESFDVGLALESDFESVGDGGV